MYVMHAFPFLLIGHGGVCGRSFDSWWAGIAGWIGCRLPPEFRSDGLSVPGSWEVRTAGGTLPTRITRPGAFTLPWAGIDVWKSYFAMGDVYYRSYPPQTSSTWVRSILPTRRGSTSGR